MINLVLAAADAAHRAEVYRHEPVAKAYLAGSIGDAEFLASRAKVDAALLAWEKAWEEECALAEKAPRKGKAAKAADAGQLALF